MEKPKYPKGYNLVADREFFGGNRIRALNRDGWKCVKCGMTNRTHRRRFKGKGLVVDHIDGNGTMKPREQRNNRMNNLQTLCCPCHGRKDYKRPDFIPTAKLTWEAVTFIRVTYAGRRGDIARMARQFGVGRTTVQKVVCHDRWKEKHRPK